MPLVTVDGTRYVPADQGTNPLVAIAITTRNRPDVLEKTLKHIEMFTPDTFPVFVVDDASSPQLELKTGGRVAGIVHSAKQLGIPAAKNQCITMLMESGAQHFFLLDDDCYPAIEDWWRPYVEGPEPHYSYIFKDWANGKPVGDCEVVYDDGETVAYSQARGCAMYLHRSVIERVGGFDTDFGIGMNEHLEFSQRICNAGLTTFPYQDVPDGDRYWYSLDRAQDVVRTIPGSERTELLKRNDLILEEKQGSTAFVEYRRMGNIVVTQLLTRNIDGQRGKKWDPDPGIVAKWAASIRGGEPVVLTDEIASSYESAPEFVQMATGWDIPHLQRWVSTLQHLHTRRAKWVWVTDGSDVEMLREPWDGMVAGTLYVGSEPCTIGKPWLVDHHPYYAWWIKEHSSEAMLNSGLVGGDYATVVEFLGDMVRELAAAYGRIDYEMGTFNYLLRQAKWRGRISFGPHVNTVFKADEKNNTTAWWKHK